MQNQTASVRSAKPQEPHRHRRVAASFNPCVERTGTSRSGHPQLGHQRRLVAITPVNADTLSRQAIRLAQRKSRKAGRALRREEVLRLKVQTVEPWKRMLIIGMGLLGGVFSYVCYRGHAPVWIWGGFGLCSVAIILCGAFGRKAYLDRELQKLTDDISARILDAIGNAL
jgi:hypothetical protein